MVSHDWHTEQQLVRRAGELRMQGLAALQQFAAAEEYAAEVFDKLADRGGDRSAYRRAVAESARREAARVSALVARWEWEDAIRRSGEGGQRKPNQLPSGSADDTRSK